MNLNGVPDMQLAGTGAPRRAARNSKTSDFTHITEYDPDFNPAGVQALASLGLAGPAPMVFPYNAKTGHITPAPAIFAKAETYNRKGRADFTKNGPCDCSPADFPAASRTSTPPATTSRSPWSTPTPAGSSSATPTASASTP